MECDSARLDGPLFSGRLIRIPPSAVSRSPAPPWVAGSPVVFLVATLRWPPVRCAAGLVFLWGAAPREGRTLGALKVVGLFCPQAHAGHFGRLVGRLNHDRTKRHWQSSIFAPEDYSGTPRQPTPRLMEHVAVNPFSSWTSNRLGRGDPLGVNAPYGAS